MLPIDSLQHHDPFTPYHILRQWYVDSDNMPTPEQCQQHFQEDRYTPLVQHLKHYHQQPLNEEEHNEWGCHLQPLLKEALATARLVSNEKVGRALSKYHSTSALDQRLVVQDSTIVNAGLGLFNGSTRPILKGETVCHYTGLLHNHQSKREQEDQSYMAFVGYVNAFDEDVFVDAKSVLGVKARYMNDPIDHTLTNVKWGEHTDVAKDCVCVGIDIIATKDIAPDEEIFVSYGDEYWAQSDVKGTVFGGNDNEYRYRSTVDEDVVK